MRRIRLALAVAALMVATACAHNADYEICDTPNCGDNVTIEVE